MVEPSVVQRFNNHVQEVDPTGLMFNITRHWRLAF